MEIRARTVTEAWPRILGRVIDFGDAKYIKGHSQWAIEMDEPIVTTLSNPLYDMIPPDFGWSESTLDRYAEQFMNPINEHGFAYTYGERIHMNNQVDNAVWMLRYDHNSRQAVINTWNVSIDQCAKYPPCMMSLDYKIYNNKLNTVVYFRSNDMYMAWPADLYGIIRLSEHIANRLDVGIGKVTVISNAPHVYFSLVQNAMQVAGIDRKEIEERYQIICNDIYGRQEIEGAIP